MVKRQSIRDSKFGDVLERRLQDSSVCDGYIFLHVRLNNEIEIKEHVIKNIKEFTKADGDNLGEVLLNLPGRLWEDCAQEISTVLYKTEVWKYLVRNGFANSNSDIVYVMDEFIG